MKIVHLNTSSDVGGAAIATRRLSMAMNSCGITSQLITFASTPKVYSKIKYPVLSRLYKYFTPCSKLERGLFSYARLGYDVSELESVRQADVIYIHWINDLLSLRNIDKLRRLGKPIIIYMHDMWHITGGCHHSFECDGYKSTCSSCPMFTDKILLAKEQLKKKMKIFRKCDNLAIVSPSTWLTGCVKESILFKNARVETIPNCLDLHIFKQVDKISARKFLNLPLDKRIIGFGAHKGVANPYKGWSYLQEALKKFTCEDFVVLIFGSDFNEKIVDSLPFNVYFSGYIYDEYSMVLLYNAIDLFVMPSLAEAFGQVAVEAMACGSGVVGFDTGGIPDIIKHQERGYLAKAKDSKDLARGIKFMLETSMPQARVWVERTCSFEVVGQKHKELCISLL